MFTKLLTNVGILEKTSDGENPHKPIANNPTPQQPIPVANLLPEQTTISNAGTNAEKLTATQDKILSGLYAAESFNIAKRFLDTFNSFEGVIPEANTRMLATFKAVSVDGVSKDQLIESLLSSEVILNDITNTFQNTFIARLQQQISNLDIQESSIQQQIGDLSKQLNDLNTQKQNISDQLTSLKQETAIAQSNFTLAKDNVTKQLTVHINNLTAATL